MTSLFLLSALNAFVAAIPDSTALAPEATTARGWSDCFVLHPPPQQQQQEQEEPSRQQDAAQETDPHLLLLLSLLRPDLWPPLKLSETLQVRQNILGLCGIGGFLLVGDP